MAKDSTGGTPSGPGSRPVGNPARGVKVAGVPAAFPPARAAARLPEFRRTGPAPRSRSTPKPARRKDLSRNGLLMPGSGEEAGKVLQEQVWGFVTPERGMYLAFRRDSFSGICQKKSCRSGEKFFGNAKKARLGAIPGLYCHRFRIRWLISFRKGDGHQNTEQRKQARRIHGNPTKYN